MKLLIAMTMMVFTSTSVFAACSATSAGDCKLQAECEKLNVGGKKVVEWRIQSPQQGQCMKVSVEDANTDCSSINSSSGAKGTQDSGSQAKPSDSKSR